MACVLDCTGTGELRLLSTMKCILVDGHVSTQPRKIRGMGGKSVLNDLPTLTFKVNIKSKSDLNSVFAWWTNDLDYGYNAFKMNGYFFGWDKEVNVRMTNDLKASFQYQNLSEIELKVEILDDLSGQYNIDLNNLQNTICNLTCGG